VGKQVWVGREWHGRLVWDADPRAQLFQGVGEALQVGWFGRWVMSMSRVTMSMPASTAA
jgi:hypothetical protein